MNLYVSILLKNWCKYPEFCPALWSCIVLITKAKMKFWWKLKTLFLDRSALVLFINLRVRDVIPYVLVKCADTHQLEFDSIFSQINIHTFINSCKAIKHVKALVMRAALKLSIRLKSTISLKLKRLCIFCERGPS